MSRFCLSSQSFATPRADWLLFFHLCSDKLKTEHSIQNEEYKELLGKKLREDRKKKNKAAKAGGDSAAAVAADGEEKK
jgi:hypothetical protein